MRVSTLKVFLMIVFINSFLPAQNYEIKFDSLNASGWFGGDSRPGEQRNVAVAQSIIIEQPVTLESFAFYFTSSFDSASSASGIGYEVTLRLHIRDSAGVILQTENVVVPDTFSGGWVAWQGINIDLTYAGKYIFSTYLLGGYDSLPVNSGQGCDLNFGYLPGERFTKYVTNDGEAEEWVDWSEHPWDSNFWLTGSLIPTNITDDYTIFQFSLGNNYPNPFNPETTIEYSIASTTHIRITVFNSLGQLVEILTNEIKTPGNYRTNFNAGNLASGTYLYRLQSGAFIETKKMILLK